MPPPDLHAYPPDASGHPPAVLPRHEHGISRRAIDPEALRVLYRLTGHNYQAFLVGGSVRDLLLGRSPKDFDVGTNARPNEIRRLFRNAFVIGRRFRLVHVKFGEKTIETSTFRRPPPPCCPDPDGHEGLTPSPGGNGGGNGGEAGDAWDALNGGNGGNGHHGDDIGHAAEPESRADLLQREDNHYGTPPEDALRRDFTINALFYDIRALTVVDYAGGLADLRNGLVRAIGDPDVRFREDPARMLRAARFASRLGFDVEEKTRLAISRHHAELAKTSPPRLLEETLRLFAFGSSEKAFRLLAEWGLMADVLPCVLAHTGADSRLWRYLAALDAGDTVCPEATPALMLATLLYEPLAARLSGGAPTGPCAIAQAPLQRLFAAASALLSEAARRLPITRRMRERATGLLLAQGRFDRPAKRRQSRAIMAAQDWFPEALALREIHQTAWEGPEASPGQLDAWRMLCAEQAELRENRRRERRESGHREHRRRDREAVGPDAAQQAMRAMLDEFGEQGEGEGGGGGGGWAAGPRWPATLTADAADEPADGASPELVETTPAAPQVSAYAPMDTPTYAPTHAPMQAPKPEAARASPPASIPPAKKPGPEHAPSARSPDAEAPSSDSRAEPRGFFAASDDNMAPHWSEEI